MFIKKFHLFLEAYTGVDVDTVLDKISSTGMRSLSPEEQALLSDASSEGKEMEEALAEFSRMLVEFKVQADQMDDRLPKGHRNMSGPELSAALSEEVAKYLFELNDLARRVLEARKWLQDAYLLTDEEIVAATKASL